MRLLLLTALLGLTGCATPPEWLAAHYDRQDPCQSHGQKNFQYPSFCGGSGQARYVTRNNYGQTIAVTRLQK